MNNNEKFLWVVVGLLCISQAFLFWHVYHGVQQPVVTAIQPTGAVAHPGSNTAPLPSAGVTVVNGTLQSVNGSDLSVATPAGTVLTVHLTSTTKLIKSDGSPKDANVQQTEMDAYNKESAQLEQDPVKNAVAIENLMVPNPFVETPIMVSDLKAGDKLAVYSFGQNSDSSYTAQQVVDFYKPN